MADLSGKEWRGIFAASFTPLTEDEQLDGAAFEKLARELFSEGLRGLYVTGSTGEGYALADNVRSETFRIAAQAARAKDGRIIAHIGAVHTRRAIALARQAAERGCHAIAAIPPTGWRYTYDELSEYYTSIAAASPLPLLVYHIPEVSGYDFSREQLSRWLDLPNVAGIKYTSPDLFKMERLITLHPDKLIYHGVDQTLMFGLTCGAAGAIGSTYNLTGRLAMKILAAVERLDFATARRGQAALNAFIETKINSGFLNALKALAAKRFGWPSARSPLPAHPARPEDVQALEKALQQALQIGGSLS